MKTTHPAYDTLSPLWTKVRDVVAGEEVVKAAGTRYLPLLASQQDNSTYARESYESYLMRASFYGAAGRTVQGLVGAIMRKEPAVKGLADDDLRDIQDAIGINYESAQSLATAQASEAVSVGRYAIMVDKGEDPESKPYAIVFRAEDVIDWEESEVRGRMELTAVKIKQMHTEPDEADPTGIRTKETPQHLILRLGPVPEQWEGVPGFEGFAGAPSDEPVYWQEIWREQKEGDGKKSFGKAPTEIKVPTKSGGRFWAEIPCDIVNAEGGIRAETEKPPMLALANTILAHYRSGADLEWGRHMMAIPQPYATGYTPDDKGERLVVGCGYLWAFPDSSTSVGYLEFAGGGLGSIENGLEAKEKLAAIQGARMLEGQPNQAEAMGTVRLRQSGDRSILSTIAHNVSEAMTRAIQRYLAWQYPRYDSIESLREVSYELATDFDSVRMDPAEMTSLTQLLQEGAISWETFVHNLRRGELLPPDVTDDEERDRIKASGMIRKPSEVAAMLQADVREGRISKDTYLDEMQKLGLLEGVDLAAEADKVYADKVTAAELQMLAFSQAGGSFNQPGPTSGDGGEFGAGIEVDGPDDSEPNPEQQEEEEETEEDEVVEEEDDEEVIDDVPIATLNELTLGVERLVRAGNKSGANALLAQAADLLGIKSLGKVGKPQ